MNKNIKLLDNVYFVQHGKIYRSQVKRIVHEEEVLHQEGYYPSKIVIKNTYYVSGINDYLIELDSSDVFKSREELIKSIMEDWL